LEGLARALQAVVGAKMQQNLRADYDAKQQSQNDAILNALAPPTETPGVSMAGSPLNVSASDGFAPMSAQMQSSTPSLMADNPNRAKLESIMSAVGPDALAQYALKSMAPKEPIKLGATDRLIDPTSYGQLVGAAPNPNQPFNPDGTPNQAYQQYELSKAATGRPVTNLSVNTDRSFGSQLGGNAASILNTSYTAAQGGLQTIDTANQIRHALDTGKVSAGPGATAIQTMNQVFGGDPQKLVATRQTIQGLAKLALSARGALKGQGQISDYEGKLLLKASSGDIDSMSVPEIRAITDVADRAARIAIKQNEVNVNRARNVPGSNNVVDFYTVPMPPAYQPPKAASAGPARVQNDADYAKLPSGTQFIGPDGKVRVKP
jgi:hypothetical protein